MKKILSVLILLTLAAAQSAFSADNAELTVADAYARAVPPNAPNSAAFMQISNSGDEARYLVSVTSDVSKVTELHNHINDNGVMRMRQVPRITVPAGGSVSLEPGSFHVMLIGLKESLNMGDTVNLTLRFDDGSEKALSIQAKKVMGMMMKHKHH